MDCVFCKIIKGEIPSYKIYEDDLVYAFLDINPNSSGHTLVIPKNHTLDFNTIDDDTLSHLMKVTRKQATIICNKLNADGYTLVQNNGFVQEVKHFHMHIVPKYFNEKKLTVEEAYKKITE